MLRKFLWLLLLLFAVVTPVTIYAKNHRKDLGVTPTALNGALYTELWSDTPIYAQGDLLNGVACAPTAVSMVLGHYNATSNLPDPTPSAFINMVGEQNVIAGEGMPFSSMVPALHQLGYTNVSGQINTTLEQLNAALTNGPVIITTGVSFATGQLEPGSASHALVVVGATTDDSMVMVQDPFQQMRESVPKSEFVTMWANGQDGMFVVRP